MLPCYSCYICETWRSKEVRVLKSSYGGGKKKVTKKGNFYGAIKTTQRIDPSTSLPELPTYFSLLWCTKIYTLHNIPLIKFFSLDLFYLYYLFFINLQITTEWAFAFFNTTIIIFSLIYSLNVPNGGCFQLTAQYSSLQNSYFSDISLQIIFLIFRFVSFYHCHGHSLSIFSRSSSQILLNISGSIRNFHWESQ